MLSSSQELQRKRGHGGSMLERSRHRRLLFVRVSRLVCTKGMSTQPGAVGDVVDLFVEKRGRAWAWAFDAGTLSSPTFIELFVRIVNQSGHSIRRPTPSFPKFS